MKYIVTLVWYDESVEVEANSRDEAQRIADRGYSQRLFADEIYVEEADVEEADL